MTRAEALTEARKRYGPDGWVTFNEEGRYQVGFVGVVTRAFTVSGEAWQGWEEAFEDADRKGNQ